MTAWLIETLVWTAVLIAAVLFVRRPVARWFGPQVAYALWALPVLRLILPPIELPAWMAPVQASEPAQGSDPFAFLDPANLLAAQEGAGAIEAAAPVTAASAAGASAAAAKAGDTAPIPADELAGCCAASGTTCRYCS